MERHNSNSWLELSDPVVLTTVLLGKLPFFTRWVRFPTLGPLGEAADGVIDVAVLPSDTNFWPDPPHKSAACFTDDWRADLSIPNIQGWVVSLSDGEFKITLFFSRKERSVRVRFEFEFDLIFSRTFQHYSILRSFWISATKNKALPGIKQWASRTARGFVCEDRNHTPPSLDYSYDKATDNCLLANRVASANALIDVLDLPPYDEHFLVH